MYGLVCTCVCVCMYMKENCPIKICHPHPTKLHIYAQCACICVSLYIYAHVCIYVGEDTREKVRDHRSKLHMYVYYICMYACVCVCVNEDIWVHNRRMPGNKTPSHICMDITHVCMCVFVCEGEDSSAQSQNCRDQISKLRIYHIHVCLYVYYLCL
jgi:hypothetical protein